MVSFNFICPKKISDFDKKESGFFCGDCNKSIKDFTEKSNEEIQKIVNNSVSEVCGIVHKQQVNNPLSSRLISNFRIAFLFVFIFGLTAFDVNGQDTIATPIPIVEVATPINNMQIEGYVYEDSDSTALPFSKIKIVQGDEIRYAKSNLDGYFCVEFDANPNEFINVTFISMFRDTLQVVQIPPDDGYAFLEVYMTTDNVIFMGFIGIIYPNPPLIDKDPYGAGKTVINQDDLRNRP